MHQFFEITIEQLIALSTEDFLGLCSAYLTAALADDIDRESAEYARRWLGIRDIGGDCWYGLAA